MNIIHVVEPFASGVAVFVQSLAETMKDDLHIIIHGERKQVMPAADVKKLFPKDNVRFIRWKSAQRSINPLKDLLALGELYTILRRLNRKNLVDAVHLHSSKSGLLGRAACRMAGLENIVYTPNGAPFLGSRNPLAAFFYQQLERFGNRLGGQVVCCSRSEGAEYERIGIRCSFINNGVSGLGAENGLPAKPSGKFRIVTSGRIIKQKNPDLFNRIARTFEAFGQFEFIWAGDGEDRAQLTASNITVTGWVTPEEVKKWVGESDIYLSTSVYEGLSFGVLEAMALRKPVLLSQCVGNRDVIHKGLNGDLFDSETEAMIKIFNYFNNRDMLQVMGEFSHEIYSNNFDARKNFRSYREFYSNKQSANLKPSFHLKPIT